MIDWKAKFDRVYILGFTKNKDRVESLLTECARVGIPRDLISVHWNSPTPFDRFLIDRMPHEPILHKNIGFFNASLGHYFCINEAYGLGYNHVMILEDDARFLNDLAKLEEELNELPDNYDIAIMDVFAGNARHQKEFRNRLLHNGNKVSKHYWFNMNVGFLRSCACYALNRYGMEKLKWLFESPVVTTCAVSPCMRICDHWWDPGILAGSMRLDFRVDPARRNEVAAPRTYVAHPNLAVQSPRLGATNSGNANIWTRYRWTDTEFSHYNI